MDSVGAPEMMFLALRGQEVHLGTESPSYAAAAFAYSNTTSWQRRLWGEATCVNPNGSVIIFNAQTKFLTACFITAVAAGLSLVMLVPMLMRILELRKSPRADATIQGQLSALLAFVAPLLVLYTERAPLVVGTCSFGLVVALLGFVQDGRVVISVPELLIYWLGFSFVYFGWALDAFLSTDVVTALPKIVAAVAAVLVFVLELCNSERQPQNKYDDTSIFAKISISYVQRFMKPNSVITHESLLDPPSDMDALLCNDQLTQIMEKYPYTSKYRVVLALKDLLMKQILKMIALAVTTSLVTMVYPQVMGHFLASLTSFTKGKTPIYESYYLALLLGVLPIIATSFEITETVCANYVENKARASLMTIMYRKALRLSPDARSSFEPSKIMNMLSVDTQQVFFLASSLPNLVSLPITLVLSVWQLWYFLGPSFFSAIVVYILIIPLSTKLSTTLGALFPALMQLKDERNRLTTNAFRCIKSLKLHAWEKPFYERICVLRDTKELKLLLKKIALTISMTIAWNTSGDLVAAAVFITFLYFKLGVLSAEIVFPSLVLLQNASSCILFFPQALNSILQALNAQRRINELLIASDQDYANYTRLSQESATGFDEKSIIVDHADIGWTKDTPVINNISFEASRSDLVCIVGRVGSGKSALCQALCGDLRITKGEVCVKGAMAYCSQDAWLQNYTIRQNIIFGQSFDEDWYETVIDACQLKDDIQQMPFGDETEVGERGISLSGGQKARVAIARAVYSRADVLVLDDVLSAVDEHVGTALILQLFSSEGLLANRTIVLATNNVRVLSHSSLIIALENKQVVEAISFKDVVARGDQSVVYRLIEEFGHKDDLDQESEHIVDRKTVIEHRERSDPSAFPPNLREKPGEISSEDIRSVGDKAEEDDVKEVNSGNVFARYMIGDHKYVFISWLFILGFSTIVTNSSIVYMGYISSHNLHSLYDGRWDMLGFVAINVFSGIFIGISHAFILVKIGLRNSRDYHNGMLWNVLHAPMQFFDKTPLGRLINRFSGDISMLDDQMPTMFYYTLRSSVNCLTVIGGILLGSPIVILAIVPLAWIANVSRVAYVPIQRKITRIGSAANSPILSHIEDSLKGQTTVRAFDHVSQFIDIFDQRVNYWTKAAFYSANLTLWLGFRVQALTTVLSLVCALASTQLVSVGYLTTGYAGVILNFAQRAGVMVRQTIMFLAQAETSSVALERLMEFIDIKQEAAAVIEATRPEGDWPATGKVVFDHLSAKYTPDGPEVLKDLSFTINGGEKIGIVGRTGSGKSTLTLAIFRIIEACKGEIKMDDIDTSLLGLFDLRSRLSIIPQDAQIFDSTVRENLDPLKTVDDARLWEVLDLCKLKDHFAAADGLDTELTDSGSNLSRGQAQLLCLGRALVHKSKVLVLDEATASVDQETDRLVQETIRRNFADRTIITIAHRLNTIMDSDRIIVLDKGQIREFDTPDNLMAAQGLFYSLRNSEQVLEEKEENS